MSGVRAHTPVVYVTSILIGCSLLGVALAALAFRHFVLAGCAGALFVAWCVVFPRLYQLLDRDRLDAMSDVDYKRFGDTFRW